MSTVSKAAVEAGQRAYHKARNANAARIVAAAPNKPGWDREAWEQEHPHVDCDRAFAQAVADVVHAELVEHVLALHPKVENPTRGCCAPPKLCKGHAPECHGKEHSLHDYPTWPCPTLRALGVEQ